MIKKYVLGIDIGTSGCKTIIVDEQGNVVTAVTTAYPLYTPEPGYSEQNPADWWSATVNGIRSVLEKSGLAPKLIMGIGLSGQMHGMVPLDKDSNVIRRAILWNDQRTVRQCAEIVNAAGGEEKLISLTNNLMLPGYTGGKILWLRENEAPLYDRVRMILNPKDYIRFMLTGEYATEVSDASGTGLFDVKNRCWSDRLLSILDIPKDMLPRCYESDEVTGILTETAAGETGLRIGTPVVGGGGDAVIQTTGMGLIKEGVLGLTIGTSGVAAMGLGSFVPNAGGKLQVFCNNARNLWHVMGVTLNAGGSYQWYKNNFCEAEKIKAQKAGKDVYDILDEDASMSPPGSRNLIFLPYLSGERCPYPDPAARGAFIGLTLLHNKADMTRSIMEGVLYSLRQVNDLITKLDRSIRVSEIIVSGGGSRSALWRQIQADVFQSPVRTVSGSAEGGAYGAALVAGVGCGLWSDLSEAAGNSKTESETLPNSSLKGLYDELYETYVSMYPALTGVFNRLSSGTK